MHNDNRLSDFEGQSAEVNNPKTGRTMNVRLTEIGPRMTVRFVFYALQMVLILTL